MTGPLLCSPGVQRGCSSEAPCLAWQHAQFGVHRAEEPASTRLRDLTTHCLPNPEQVTLPL